jgi:hemoglobin
MAQTLFERYGGFAQVSKIVSEFYDRALESPVIGYFFAKTDMRRQIDHQTKFISSLLGGPASFTDEQLKTAHAHLAINDEAFEEMSSLLEETLEDSGFEPSDVAYVKAEITRRRHIIVSR